MCVINLIKSTLLLMFCVQYGKCGDFCAKTVSCIAAVIRRSHPRHRLEIVGETGRPLWIEKSHIFNSITKQFLNS